MDIKDSSQRFKRLNSKVEEFCRTELPTKIGNKAESIIKENFRKGGFQDGNSFTKWAVTRRQLSGGKGAGFKLGPLLSSRKHLYDSTRHKTGDGKVTVYNNVPYAIYHNKGASIKVTPKMRGYAWIKYRDAGGGKGDKGKISAEASLWKGLALTKKSVLKIPKRQFMGPSKTIDAAVTEILKKEINQLLKTI